MDFGWNQTTKNYGNPNEEECKNEKKKTKPKARGRVSESVY
jgi:hypothetical protein